MNHRSAYFYETENQKMPAKNWIDSLKDKSGQAKILTRIRRAEKGNFGDHKWINQNIGELKITYGPGYRVYYGIDKDKNLIILLTCGDKSTQTKDIKKANKYWLDYQKRR